MHKSDGTYGQDRVRKRFKVALSVILLFFDCLERSHFVDQRHSHHAAHQRHVVRMLRNVVFTLQFGASGVSSYARFLPKLLHALGE